MDYYEKKRRFFIELREILEVKKRCDINDLYYVATNRYGFGNKVVDDMLKLEEQQEHIQIKGKNVLFITRK